DKVCINIKNTNITIIKTTIVTRDIVMVITVMVMMMLYFGVKEAEKSIGDTSQEANLIVEHWVRSSTIKRGWIYEFNKIIAKYAKGFKLSKVLKRGSYDIGKLAFSADGRKFYLIASDWTFEIWDIALGKKIQNFDKSNEMKDFIVFSPDGSTFVSNTNNGMQSWDIESGKKVMRFEGIIEPYTKIQFSSDGKHIAAILHNYDIRFWDVDSGKQIQRLEEKNNENEKYSPNRQIVAFSTTRTVSLWDMKLGKKVKEIDMNDTLRAKLSPDGRFLAYLLYGTITIMDLELNLESENVLTRRYTTDWQYIPNSQAILVECYEGPLLLCDIKSGYETKIFDITTDITEIVISPNGNTLLVSSGNTIEIWE
ncbi:WD-40 repeat-containing protein, partial [Reticulomyxa filosa]